MAGVGAGARDMADRARDQPGTDRERSDAQSSDPSDRNGYRRPSRGRPKLPPEYADFKLADGRTLRDVMGDKFFGAAGKSGGGKWLSKGVFERLRQSNFPFPGGMSKQERTPPPNWRDGQQARLDEWRTRAEAARAKQQARREEQRALFKEKLGSRPGKNLTFGGGL